MGIAPDRYDSLRRQWIHDHLWYSEIQRARMEKLDIQIRRRYAAKILAAPSRRDDYARNPLLARGHVSVIGKIEWFLFGVMMLFIPIGWLAGKGVYKVTVALIPATLRSYPIVAFLWLALIPGALIVVLYDPAPGLGAKVFWPWVAAQLPATLLIAGLYGVVEGWLAVPGALQLRPANLPPLEISPVDAAAILGADDITAPPLIPSAPTPNLGEMTPPMRSEPRR
ncbi:hypothetical protein [Mycolicibacterium mageritense]|uniref:hypothetical protein n=1 Tax=Mycolicibacterium mageritense TaxID=53462 RepID=UPI0011DBB473|nr:hypothetical protein [Mycolicibacterium mageritense]TXI56448.1 MAG: hypothetical protein E6Q55_28700 [Mycolicibacterium mageritense]